MRKLITIITLCTITSLSMATPAVAADVTSIAKYTSNVKISSNIEDTIAQLCNLDGKQLLSQYVLNNSDCVKKLSSEDLSALKQSIIKDSKDCTVSNAEKAKASKKTKKAKKATITKPSVTTKPSTTITKPSTTITKPSAPTKPSATPTPKPSTTPTKPSATPTPKPSTTTEANNTTSNYREFQKQVITLVNKERAAAGVGALAENAELNKVATAKSEDMAKLGYFSHTSPTYGSPFDMLKQFGVKYSAAGENIAYGQSTPEEVMKGWMNSEGHRANILSSNYTQIGVGIAKKANGQYVWTQTFSRP